MALTTAKNCLVSAGTDGKICIWEIENDFNLVRQITLNYPIYAACIINKDELAIGDG